jgi:hypothetical protein
LIKSAGLSSLTAVCNSLIRVIKSVIQAIAAGISLIQDSLSNNFAFQTSETVVSTS